MLVSNYKGSRWEKKLAIGLVAMVMGLSFAPLLIPQRAFAQNVCTTGTLSREDYKEQCGCKTNSPDDCGIVAYIQVIINILSAVAGVVIVIGVVIGGIQYAMAHDNPQEVEAARTRIRNAIIALLAFIFTYAFLQYVVPGGVF